MFDNRINDVLRAGDVTRWHVVRTAKQQTLAEHLFNVTAVAVAIVDEMGICDPPLKIKVIERAMAHDINEVFDGDIPTPAKYRTGDEHTAYLASFLDMDIYDQIVKMADIMETTWFIQQNMVGPHAKRVYERCLSRYSLLLKHCEGDTYRAVTEVWRSMNSSEFKDV